MMSVKLCRLEDHSLFIFSSDINQSRDWKAAIWISELVFQIYKCRIWNIKRRTYSYLSSAIYFINISKLQVD